MHSPRSALVGLLGALAAATATLGDEARADEADAVEVRPDEPLLRGAFAVPSWVPPTIGGAAAAGGVAYLVLRTRRRR
jgi:hypothetical protein